MDGHSIFLTKGTEAIGLATALDNANQHEDALEQYKLGIDLLCKAVKYEKNPKAVEMIKANLTGYMDRAEKIKKGLSGEEHHGAGGSTIMEHKKNSDKKGDDEKTKLESQMMDSILSEKPNVKWNEVAGLELAKEFLKEAVVFPIKFPQLFTGKRKAWKGILLYGPPGTGKTYLAKAVATEADSTFFPISSSDLMSKWIGEGENKVRALFAAARKSKPSVIFIDEIDSVATVRSEGENEASRRMKTEIMTQMDGMGHDMEGILVLAATNRPWEIDTAILRRLPKKVYISLPEAAARTHMFQLNLGDTPHNLSPEQFATLGEMTPLYSGSDIATATNEALMEPLRKSQRARQFFIDTQGGYTPCDEYPACPHCPPDLTPDTARTLGYTHTVSSGHLQCSVCHSVHVTIDQVPGPALKAPVVTYNDFIRALRNSKPVTNAAGLIEYENWTKESGSQGN